MEYRKLSTSEAAPSLLGFGCMRFPLNEDGTINEAEAERMIDKAMACGVNYIDTAYPYHNGDSEPLVGRILKKYDRESFYLATKLTMWAVNSLEEAKELFAKQLARLDTTYVDFYLLHALNAEKWQKVKEYQILPWLIELKKQGVIRHLGFSFHDSYEVFEEILSYYPWDFCQIQYNYVDRDIQAGDRGYALTEEKNIPLMIMEPVKGGSLSFLPEDLANRFKAAAPERSISSWALRFVASKPNVRVVLSGMSTMEQVEDNLATFSDFQPLTKEELTLVEDVAEEIKKLTRNGCTGCAYCMPCPNGVDIPQNFKIWNNYAKYENKAVTAGKFKELPREAWADNCVACGACEEVCPQQLSIREDLHRLCEELL